MPVKLSIAGRPPLVIDDEYISLGSDPSCSLTFPDAHDVMAKHAVIHLVAGRWLIEVRQAKSILVGGTEPKQMHWLSPGDVIQLSETGPAVTFDLTNAEVVTRGAKAPRQSDVLPLPVEQESPPENETFRLASDMGSPRDSDPIIPVTKPTPREKPASSAAGKTPKPPSSAIIPVLKSSAPSTSDASIPPLSSTYQTSKPPSSKTIKTTKTPSSDDGPIEPRSSSSVKGTPKAPSSTTIRTTKPPSSTTIKTRVPLSDDSIPTGDAAAKQKRSDSNIRTPGGKKPGSKSQPSSHDSEFNESEAKLPVLKRITSWEEPIPEIADDMMDEWGAAPSRHRSKFGEEQDIRFIKQVVIYCAAVVIGIIILWQGGKEIMKAINGPRLDMPATMLAPKDSEIS